MIAPGTRLGPYVISASIGSGGMGEVYRATDTNLKRAVAIKVLPAAVATDRDRLARFQREAEVLASLNHPNIAAIYGVEEANGTRALVVELADGRTLADRISQGPIPVAEALPIAKQIAEALEAAHEHGIIHRDLKPANIKLRPDGVVKVLDFGLAKALEPASATGVGATASPTMTSPALMTGVGVLLGTAAYMSPEQARGDTVDKRADIWAFGCVLYEMLTGKRAFQGENVSDVLASVLARESDWTILPAGLSPVLGTFVKRCLHKNRRYRIGDAQSLRLALEGAFDTDAGRARSSETAMRSVAAASAAAVALGGLLGGTAVRWSMSPAPPRVVRTEVTTSGATALNLAGSARDIAITPDGSRIVYRGLGQLFVRPIDQLEPVPIRAVGNPYDVFVSPDGQWIGFFDGTLLTKVAITGGPPVTICELEAAGRGATWGGDGTIVFATASSATGLQRVSADGGTPTALTTPDHNAGEGDHVLPQMLPGGRALLLTVTPANGNADSAQI
jgi:serine/threonine-protein kinase